MARLKDQIRAAGGSIGDVLNIPVELLDPDPDNWRISGDALNEHIESIAADIMAYGFIRSKVLEISLSENGRYIVQDGNNRLLATRLANTRGAQVLTLPCLMEPEGLSPPDRLARKVIANQGLHYTDAEYASIILKYRSWGWDDERIATRLQRSVPWLLNKMTLAAAPAPIRKGVDEGIISATEAVNLVRAEGDAQAVETLAKAARIAGGRSGKKQGRVTAATIREVHEAGSGARKPRSSTPSTATDDPPATQRQSHAAKMAETLNDKDRVFELTTVLRAIIDAYEGAGGELFLQALEDGKVMINWEPVC